MLFKLGDIVLSDNINHHISQDHNFARFISDCINDHARGLWGDLEQDDWIKNTIALLYDLQIKSAFNTSINDIKKIYIITTFDRTKTMIISSEEIE